MNELFQTVEELKVQTQYHHSTIKTSLKQIKTLIDYSPEHVEEIFTLLERNKISLKELDK